MDATSNQTAPENGKGLGGRLTEPVQVIAQHGKEKFANLTDQWRSDLQSSMGQRKNTVVDSLGTVAETLREACHKLEENGNESLGSYMRHGQQMVERLSGYLDGKEIAHIARDVRAYAHRNPTLVVGGLFALGCAAGRFLRSSAPPEVPTKALAIRDGAAWK